MKYLHAKSPCCHGKTIKYGGRRRQCVLCKKTWRIRKKKRGRNTKRKSLNLFLKYLKREIPSLYVLSRIKQKSKSKNRKKSEDQLQREVKYGLNKFLNNNSWPKIPTRRKLITIADAMVETISKKTYAFYFILLKTVKSNKAIIVKPYIKLGNESWLGWQEAFYQLPESVLTSIKALVGDGSSGLMSIAKRRKWIIQRCHFHLLARIQGRRSRWARSRHRELGERLYFLAKEIITNPDEAVINHCLKELEIIKTNTGSQILRKYLSGFIKNYKEYRTYLYYPELNLPLTSNTAESLISDIRNLFNRAHGFRTIHSSILWINALLKYKKFATCNGKLPTKLTR